jgi:hypothetical protein
MAKAIEPVAPSGHSCFWEGRAKAKLGFLRKRKRKAVIHSVKHGLLKSG